MIEFPDCAPLHPGYTCFFLGGNNVIEYLFGADGLGYDLTPLIA
jgi:hypothetical protein